MDEISRKVLESVHDCLCRLTHAQNLSQEQLTEIHMSATALAYQIRRMDYPEAVAAQVREGEQALARRLTDHPPAVQSRRHADVWAGQPGATLCAAIEGADPADALSRLGDVRDLLVALYEPMDPAVSAGTHSTYAGGRGDRVQDENEPQVRDLSAPLLEAWLRRTGNGAADVSVTECRKLMGGFSKSTYVVTLVDGGAPQKIVVRKDFPGLPTGSSVVSEYPVLQDMAKLEVPAPRPLWLEADSAVCDGAFMGVTFVAGEPANRAVPADSEARRSWARSIATALGRLHAGTALAGTDPRDHILQEIADVERRMLERERAPHPGLVLGLKWLRQHIDDLRGRPACRIHGDVGFHNMMIAENGVSALLDWEFSRIGDPVEDLASVKPFMEQIESWEEFYATYREICGFELDPTADRYFTVWREARNMVACIGSLNSLLLPGVRSVPLSLAGTVYAPKYEVSLLDAIKEAERTHV